MIEILIVILLILGISCLGIFLTRKFKVIKNYTSKTSTNLVRSGLKYLGPFITFPDLL